MPRVKGYSPGGGASGPASADRYTVFSGTPLSVLGSVSRDEALGAGVAIRLHEFGEHPANTLRVHEPYSGTMRAGAGGLIQQLRTVGTGLAERRRNVIGPIGDVMDRLTSILEEFVDLRFPVDRRDQLDPA